MENAVRGKEDCAPDGRSLASARSLGQRVARGGDVKLQVIRWERFLPRRFVRVLLVEHDDSTRHIVAALLRKCSYHVAVVADGLKAWEVMKEKSYSFDLVLTEFEMPSLSGIGLLSKIVGAEECKNIPVIMMSSQDSVGIVHKCMLKGAADFLVKPVRKNELRNLWQHVWRRRCSSRYACSSENNAASNQISSNTGDCSQTGENSDEGSDAQNLGSKPDVKLEISPKLAGTVLAKHGQSPRDAEAHPEQPGNYMTTIASSSVLDDNGVSRDKTLVVGDVAVQPIQMVISVENSKHASHGDDDLDLRCAGGNEKPNFHHQINSREPTKSIDGFMKSLTYGQCSHAVMKTAVIEENVSSGVARSSQMKHASNSCMPPLWELSLLTQLNGCVQHHVKQTNILNHSNASAFSRYGGTFTNSADQKSKSSSICIRNKEYVDQRQSHVSPLGTDNGKDDVKCSLFSSRGEGVAQFQMFSDENMEEVGALSSHAQPQNASAGPSNREDFHHALLDFMPIPVGAVPYTNFCTGYGPMLRPIIYQNGSLIVQSLAAAENGTSNFFSDYSRHHDDPFPSHSGSTEFRCHDLNHPLPFMGQVNDTDTGEQRDLSCNHREEVYQSASAIKDMLKGSGSNGSGDTTIDASAATGTALESGNESGIQYCSKKGTNSDLSHREAALIKFRLKRKDRCFEKKVRYHSRQKLAEQRPRVKGQFVCQKILEINTTQESEG